MSGGKPTYRIVDWDQNFENSQSRTVHGMRWVPMPNKHDGDGYCELVDHPDGPAHYGAWCTIIQVASKCQPRGTLLRDGRRPHTPESLARKTRLPAKLFRAVLPRLVTIGWVEVCDNGQRQDDDPLPADCQPTASEPVEHRASRARAVEQYNTIQDNTKQDNIDDTVDSRSESTSSSAPHSEILDAWNDLAGRLGMPKARKLTAKRKKQIRARWGDADWRESWREAMGAIASSPFCRGQNDRGWRANLDWLLRPDTVTKLVEGHYAESRASPSGGGGAEELEREIDRIMGMDDE